ncbi:MAG TPA: GNAT family N-acetyltransferase [Pyrinomonadaceae bacterium]|nr:GNAT family N-acetyltransferase [Pyrinomonadaceae bacterium]
MTEAFDLEIRLLGEADLPAAMSLKESAGWNQTEADWLRLLRLEPRGCFAATAGKRLVGTVTTTTYGVELAWVGMVLVDPSFRRRGIASRLMGAALSYLDGEGVETVKLDATPDGRHVYERLGFESELMIERWHRRGADAAADVQPERAGGAGASTIEAARLAEILELDRAAFGAARARLVELLVAESVATCVRRASDGGAGGYALARAGAVADYVGPVVASDLETAALLLDEVLARLASRPVYVDVNRQFESAARALDRRGFSKQRDLIRMRRGAMTASGTSDKVFAIAGPEVG